MLVIKIVLIVIVMRRIDECSKSKIEYLRRYRMVRVNL